MNASTDINPAPCVICGGSNFTLAYSGPIRDGRPGRTTPQSVDVSQCKTCGVQSLPSVIESLASYYEGSEYRKDVDQGASAENYHAIHDGQQIRHLDVTGTGSFRNKVVADIGCGAGSFLDALSGFAAETLAIEPSQEFRAALEKKGHQTYAYADEAGKDHAQRVDVASSFSVIEHVANPVEFLRGIRALLKPGGTLWLSTPNARDVLLQALPEYAPFFYRKVHLWYFDPASLTATIKAAGFSDCEIIGRHRFGLANFLRWLKDRRPAEGEPLPFVTPAMNAAWISELERTLSCDYLFARASA